MSNMKFEEGISKIIETNKLIK